VAYTQKPRLPELTEGYKQAYFACVHFLIAAHELFIDTAAEEK
jgi:hypothetical protein